MVSYYLSSNNILSTNITSSSLVSYNILCNNNINTVNLSSTNIFNTNLNTVSIFGTNITITNITSGGIKNTGNINTQSLSCVSASISNDLSVNNFFSTNLTTSNLLSNNATINNINTSNILCNNSILTIGSCGNFLSDTNKGIIYSGVNNGNYFTGNYPTDGIAAFGWVDGALGTKQGGNKSTLNWNTTGVGIFNTAPSYQLDVNGTTRTSNLIVGSGNNIKSQTVYKFTFAGGGTAGTNNKALWFGKTYANASNLYIQATIYENSSDVFACTIFSISTTGCTVNVYRIDNLGAAWGALYTIHLSVTEL